MLEISEEQLISAFHALAQDSLAQALGEGLLTADEAETADVAVQIAGPALTLFYAALGARGDPPSISSPDLSFSLDTSNCPAPFIAAFTLWQATVKPIQSLPSAARYDLALLLCDKAPVSSPLRTDVAKLAADLKGIALEILQRRTFQTRFQADLQAALDSSGRSRTSGESARQAAFEPPPMYSEGAPTEETKRAHEHLLASGAAQDRPEENVEAAMPIKQQDNLRIIRETLYSDAIVETPSILQQLSRGPEWASKAFFASTCLAILEVALSRMDRQGVHVVDTGRGAPKVIGAGETPLYLRPFLSKLVEVSQAVQAMAAEDDERAVKEASEGAEQLTPPRLDRLKERLAQGVGAESTLESSRSSVDGMVAQLANAINGLALAMTSLPAFRERQAEAFKILAAVSRM